MTQTHALQPIRIHRAFLGSRDVSTRARLLAILQKVSAAEFVSDQDVVTLERAEFHIAQTKDASNVVNIKDYRRAS
jgi:hypothetical protein